VAIDGPSGTGKSALVAKVALSRKVQMHFDGGVLWVTMGAAAQLAEIANCLRPALQAVSDGSETQPHTLSQTCTAMRAALGPRNCLVIADDLRNTEQLRAIWRCIPTTSTGSRFVLVARSGDLLQVTTPPPA
jgi:cytidylate kinase